ALHRHAEHEPAELIRSPRQRRDPARAGGDSGPLFVSEPVAPSPRDRYALRSRLRPMKPSNRDSASHRRFFLDRAPAGGRARLDPEESMHATSVFRVRAGDEITLFDGSGTDYDAVVEVPRKDAVGGRMVAGGAVDREPAVAVTLAAPVPKSPRFDDALRSAFELGLARFVPLRAERASVPVTDHRMRRWRRISVEAS